MSRKALYGIGINDADYVIRVNKLISGKKTIAWVCPFYLKWSNMLKRCYSQNTHDRQPTYIGCSVTKEWHLFSNFKAWMETQDWEGKYLDKDILQLNNKVYGPSTCVFVDVSVNNFFIDAGKSRGDTPIGVNKSKGRFEASCNCVLTGKQKFIGRYDTPEEAHKAWLAFKLGQAYILAAQQKDERVAKALVDRYENYEINNKSP